MGENRSSNLALHQTAEQFHILVDSVEEYAIYLLDPNGNVVTWNTGAEKIKGYRADEIIGKNFACFYTAEDVAGEKPQSNLHEAAHRGHIRDQGLRVRKDGTTFEAEVILTVLRDEKGNTRGYSKVTRDITDQIRSREFEAEKIAAEKASKAKDDFLAPRTIFSQRSVMNSARRLHQRWRRRPTSKRMQQNSRPSSQKMYK